MKDFNNIATKYFLICSLFILFLIYYLANHPCTSLILINSFIHSLTMVEENFEFWLSETLQNIFTMVEENFTFWLFERIQNENFNNIITDYLHRSWRKCWTRSSEMPQWRISTRLSQNISSPWLKKILHFDDCSRMKHFDNITFSLWLKRILDFDDLKRSRMKDFNNIITEYLHHGWRKFCSSMIWSTPEWNISTMTSSPRLKKYLDFDDLKRSRKKDFNNMITEYLHHSLRKFWILMIWNARKRKIQQDYYIISTQGLKKILDFDDLKCSRMKNATFWTKFPHKLISYT